MSTQQTPLDRNDPAVQALDAEASTLMKRGIRLATDSRPEAAVEALIYFDQALPLRRRLPFETIPSLRYGLAGCWLHRADALMRWRGQDQPLRDRDRIVAAIDAFDEAVLLLCGLPLEADPRYARRLAIAHQNRGLALHAQGPAARAAAIAAFTDAIAVLEGNVAAAIGDRQYLLAAVWVNVANLWASEATAASDAVAGDAARRAIALVAGLEERDLDAAEVGLTARHVFCQALANTLSPSGEMTDDVHDGTDAVDEALDLVRRWEPEGGGRFRNIADDLFRFGARVYAIYQPHFLDEFLRENVIASS